MDNSVLKKIFFGCSYPVLRVTADVKDTTENHLLNIYTKIQKSTAGV
jgi:hypothetical protein